MGFTAPIFTEAGRQLQLRALAGENLIFTRIGLGNGELISAAEIPNLTDLVSKVALVDIYTAERTESAFSVAASFTNEGLSAFYWREIGLFAADPSYPDDREKDILYCYQNAFDNAEYIAAGGSSVIQKTIRLGVYVGDAANVTADVKVVSGNAFVMLKKAEFEALVAAGLDNHDVYYVITDIDEGSLEEGGMAAITGAENADTFLAEVVE